MIVKHLFFSLMERLDGIEQECSTIVTEDRKQKLFREIMELRHVSDDILDHWLLFEERMTKIQELLKEDRDECDLDRIEEEINQMPDDVADKIFQEIKNATQSSAKSKSPELVAFLSGQVAHAFRKGQGYYNLFMYPEAAKHFREVIEQDPDLDIARLFLAFSEMINGEFEEAERQFHLLSSTTDHRLLKATALNAQGCLHAVHEQWDQALHFFEKALDTYPKLKDPSFNKALVLMKQGFYEDAKPIWLDYAKASREDWEVLIQLARCYLEEGNQEQAEFVLTRMTNATSDPEILFQTGQMFEDMRQFGNAALCYHILVNADPDNAGAWHGLGWNLWHAEGYPYSLSYINKAITLSPTNSDYRFSYGWILYQLQELDEAEKTFDLILEQEGFYPLALAGLTHVYMARERWKEASECCERLIADDDVLTQALGYLQLGKVFLAKSDYAMAQQYLEQSIQCSADMKDSYLLLGLVRYLSGYKDEALRIWEYSL